MLRPFLRVWSRTGRGRGRPAPLAQPALKRDLQQPAGLSQERGGFRAVPLRSTVRSMGFNRRKMEDQRRTAAEKEAASRRATDAQVLEDAERLIVAWNERQSLRLLLINVSKPLAVVIPHDKGGADFSLGLFDHHCRTSRAIPLILCALV